MAMDGSFTSAAALHRFLARSPHLQSHPRLLALSRRGDEDDDDLDLDSGVVEDVADSLAELVLHPSYTVSLLGCFRAVGERLVGKAVELLRLVVGMDANALDEDAGGADYEEVGEDEIGVIQFYAGRGRLLRLHEVACLAFCRALDLAPFLSRTILNYFSFAPPPFQRVLRKSSLVPSSNRDAGYLLDIVRVSLRVLQLDSGSFLEMWDWSCFIDVVQMGMVGGWSSDSISDDIRWCGVHILLIVLKLGEQFVEYFDLDQETALLCYKRWEEFCEDVAIEKAGFYMDSPVHKSNWLPGVLTGDAQEMTSRHSESISLSVLSTHCDEAQSIMRPCKKVACGMRSKRVPFVLTSTVQRSFEMMRLAVSQKWPILLHGPPGAGKSALILQLAEASGKRVLFLHMDEQMDVKGLIGSYVCAEQPGEFKWQPGSLTQALQNGLWTAFEDIDKAPPEVHSIIGPLFESLGSYMTGHGEAIKISEDFHLFATVSHRERDWCNHIRGSATLGSNWRKLMVGTPTDKNILGIIKTRYPLLEPLAEKIIDTFRKVNYLASCQLGYHVIETNCVDVFPRFTLRDLLKWCSRIASLVLSVTGTCLSTSDCKNIYIEAVDIFAASSASYKLRLLLMKEIASSWSIPVLEVESLYFSNKPTVQSSSFGLQVQVGRVTLDTNQGLDHSCPKKKFFAEIGTSMHNLEKVARSVEFNEPVLLVGETGTGKTTLVQNLAERLGHHLIVLNLSQQSDVSDLLGGFKPIDARVVCIPLYEEFMTLFVKTYSKRENKVLLQDIAECVNGRKWKELLIKFKCVVRQHGTLLHQFGDSGCGEKRKKPMEEAVLQHWESFSFRVDSALKQMQVSSMLFSFVEGAFVTALKDGHWVLLDEINLAPPDVLQRILGVLEGESGSLCLAERGDMDYIVRHPNFRIFACMNPATDAGKKDLPYSVRSRFTEYFVDDLLSDDDLILFVGRHLDDLQNSREIVDRIVNFYKEVKMKTQETLQDGANQKPQFSLRSLSRALHFIKKARNVSQYQFNRALYDGFCMFFLNLLDGPSNKLMNKMIISYLLGGDAPSEVSLDQFVQVDGHGKDLSFMQNYEVTKSITVHLTNLARAAFIRNPVLLQGPTSSGKTSLVRYLAAITGHEFVRINNHEHTDLQEYFGTYISDSQGKLIFHEGPLVKAVRLGHWIVLDELNLAPSDVLEALNRLLDDNRELFIPGLLETVPAHPHFMLFATQNPPTLYGGRKFLSRAFRNRFVEIFVNEIPGDELQQILKRRCKVPMSYAIKMVDIMKELQLHRQSSRAFAGKHGFMTPRDLFRWAERFHCFGCSYEDLAKEGYYLLAERLRDQTEKDFLVEVLEKHLRVKIDMSDLYRQEEDDCEDICNHQEIKESLGRIFWTTSMERLYFLVKRCYKLREPVLLVGETGGGKTFVCQLLSMMLGSKLHILNCHQYTETSDFIGGFHPVRDKSQLAAKYKYLIEQLKMSKVFEHCLANNSLSSDIEQALSTLSCLQDFMKTLRSNMAFHQVSLKEFNYVRQNLQDLVQVYQKWQTIFEWQDGPLVQAMKCGDLFLVDEISLADDSVLERLNSVLEPERVLTLAEKGGSNIEQITGHKNFFLLATMNPGGDHGKKELSPALRNRFTEIWVPPIIDVKELGSIALRRLDKLEFSWIIKPMLSFWEWFNHSETGRGRLLTVRDLLAWVAFINATESNLGLVNSFLHGAFLVLLDGLSLGFVISRIDAMKLREESLQFLLDQVKLEQRSSFESFEILNLGSYGWGSMNTCIDYAKSDHQFGISPFYILKGNMPCKKAGFEFLAPTTSRNVLRVLRALQVHKPVLLEGSPGVGKTSLVVALAEFSGHAVVRINLSEQTDIMDLLGSDLPIESEEGVKFAWSDGILLQALKDGKWVLLDELNLAPQSVLEGLNAILDHRAEVYIPELGTSFKCPSTFRVFACQNPTLQGGGRKGLPKSFLNRFTKVYADELVNEDYLFICSSLFPSISKDFLSKLICFNHRIYEDTMVLHKYGEDGSPWEFNLRDVIRSCQLIEGSPTRSKEDCFLSTVYIQRMRTTSDRKKVLSAYEEIFGAKPCINMYPRVQISPKRLIIGTATYERNHYQQAKHISDHLRILPGIGQSLEAVLHCVQHQWLCILVGTTSSGKTSLVRLLAQLTGNALHELNLSPGTDISELIGCFEQYSAFRHFQQVICQVEGYVKEYSSLVFRSFEMLSKQHRSFMSKWFTFLAKLKSTSATALTFRQHYGILTYGLLELLVGVIEHLMHDIELQRLPVSWSSRDLKNLLVLIMKLQQKDYLQLHSTKFEWVKGQLVKAIESGEWILLENANLCSPAVLDRINSLVEPSGLFTVNECGLVNGKPWVLHAHPNFRLFFTVNPSYGEVSRAMRNRGVEVFMMPSYWLLPDFKEAEMRDVKRYLITTGIPFTRLVDAMADAHLYARNKGSELGVCITFLELTHWIKLFHQLIVAGNRPLWALNLSWEHIYFSSLGVSDGNDIVDHGKDFFPSDSEFSEFGSILGHSFCLPGGWPSPLKLWDLTFCSREVSVKQNCQYLQFWGAQHAANFASIRLHEPSLCHDMLKLFPAIIPMHVLHHSLYPMVSRKQVQHTSIDFENMIKVFWFAANWTIEQAFEDDLDMYISYFKWYSCKLEPLWSDTSLDPAHGAALNRKLGPFCSFFKSYLSIFDQDIWKYLLNCWRTFSSHLHYNYDSNLQIPLLSLELVEMDIVDGHLEVAKSNLYSAINSVHYLQLCCMQWYAENIFPFEDRQELYTFYPFLRSLRQLEIEVLNITARDASIDFHVNLFDGLVERHILFWNVITSSQIDLLAICWHYMKKEAKKLQDICPSAVSSLIDAMDGVNHLKEVNSWDLETPKSLLWAYGWHPLMPSSQETYDKMEQLLCLFSSIWHARLGFSKQMCSDTNFLLKVLLSANSDIRHLVVKGVAMASCICDEHSQDATGIVEIHKLLKHRLAMSPEVQKSKPENPSSICCTFCLDVMPTSTWIESWIDTLPLLDHRSIVHELNLLLDLSRSILLPSDEEVRLAVSAFSMPLKCTLESSMKSSSRPPTDFVPHQKLLWILDGWESVDSAIFKLRSSLCEMWYRWHASVWAFGQKGQMNYVDVGCYKYGMPVALFCPIITATMDHILQFTLKIKDIHVHGVKIRAASSYIWEESQLGGKLADKLLAAARYLFGQVLLAYRKSFVPEKFLKIESILLHACDHCISQESFETLKLLIKSSSNSQLKFLMELYIEPLLGRLYLPSFGHDLLRRVGVAWMYLGGLHFHLLQNHCDPTLKYKMKYTQILGKISRLETEIMVRQESCYLAGRNSVSSKCEKRIHSKESLDLSKKNLQKKLVFRPDPRKYATFKHLYDDFKKLVESSLAFAELREERFILDKISVDKACNWQETSTKFIHRLSEECASYNDIIQPIQISIYEMKLGLSIVVSNALLKTFLNQFPGNNAEQIQETLCSFIQFPRFFTSSLDSIGADYDKSDQSLYCPLNFDINLLYKLVSVSQPQCPDKMEAVVCQIMLNIVRDRVYSSSLMDESSLEFMESIFKEFSSLWTSIKSQAKTKEEEGIQQYKFKPRAFILEDITEFSILELKNIVADDSLTPEWEEILDTSNPNSGNLSAVEHDNLIEEWNSNEEFLSQGIVCVHSQIFGSFDVVGLPVSLNTTDREKLESFMQAYKVYKNLIKVVPPLLSSSIDASLLPEHLLHLSLEYSNRFLELNDNGHDYHFYKDSNTPALAKMIEPLAAFQQQIGRLSDKNPEIQKVLHMTDLLMALPPDTPIAKALLILQFLVSRMESLLESGLKLSFSVHLKPILQLITSWKKLEVDSWFHLLDSVVKKYEISAGKLWFPLYSVLHRTVTYDHASNNLATIQSLEEFIQTSNIGEFKKRLELLLSFHGQFNAKIELNINASEHFVDTMAILYNIFGYYMQFLPQISRHIEDRKNTIKSDLKDLVKLSRWEDPHSFSKRSRQKLWKLVQKFNDVLQQPAMIFLNQEELQKSIIDVPRLVDLNYIVNELEKKPMVELTHDVVDLQFGHVERTRSLWLDDWKKLFDSVIGEVASANMIKSPLENESLFKQLSNYSMCTLFMEGWIRGWKSLQDVFHIILSSAHIWKHGSRTLEKRRAFTNLLAVLEGCGLSRHISRISEVDVGSDQLIGFFLKPAYDMHHLVPCVLSSAEKEHRLDYVSHNFASKFDRDFRLANECYFKNIFMFQRVKQICSEKFHKDLTLDQVYWSHSFLEHLLLIQQGQRSLVYGLSNKLMKIRQLIFPLKKTGFTREKCAIISNQHAASLCMRQQKKLFDGLHNLSKDMSVLLRMTKRSHIDTCSGVRAQLSDVLSLVEKFIPEMGKSKELLDFYLLDHSRLISTPKGCRAALVVTHPMEQLLVDNFQLVDDISKAFERLCNQNVPRKSVIEQMISRFSYYLEKAKLAKKMFLSADDHVSEYIDAANAFNKSCQETTKHILVALVKIREMSDNYFHSERMLTEDLLENFESFTEGLHLDLVYDSLLKTVSSAAEYANHGIKELELCRHVEMELNFLYQLVDILLSFAEGILLELLAMHRAVADITHMLANVLASLFTNGFGSLESGEEDSRAAGRTQEESGTGMGEGEGVNDVSNQIEDEEQLLGTSEKAGECLDTSKNVPNEEDKGVEMEEDFAADAYSISDGSGNEVEEDKEEMGLDSVMGEASNDKNIVDEKHWDGEEDESPNKAENYESRKSVKETDEASREMRAKDDKATEADECGGINGDEICEPGEDGKDTREDSFDEDTKEMKLEKAEALENHTDISEQHHDFEDKMNMNEPEQDGMTEHELDFSEMEMENVIDSNEDHLNEKTSADKVEVNEQADTAPSQVNEGIDLDGPFNKPVENDVALHISGDRNLEVGNIEKGNGERPKSHTMMSMDYGQPSMRSVSDMISEQNGAVPLESLHTQNILETEITLPTFSKDGNMSTNKQDTHPPLADERISDKNCTNPYRGLGDALEEWKERVQITSDPTDKRTVEETKELQDIEADEYKYVTELEYATSQALGSAMPDQAIAKIDGGKNIEDEVRDVSEYFDEMIIEEENLPEICSSECNAIFIKDKSNRNVPDSDGSAENLLVRDEDERKINWSDQSLDVVSVGKHDFAEKLRRLSAENLELGTSRKLSVIRNNNAVSKWRRHELDTSKLSQELTEQLRLILEPNKAGKLQGDYKSGKKIIMKKVITCMATNFADIKIWSRLTRPYKRDYQVIVAIDDSLSMTEGGCGEVATKALVTVCRAMSHLEVGQLAVVRFGESGNSRLLHDFHVPFTSEAGVKMLSGLGFKQDNKLGDNPVADLLKYLNEKLEGAVTTAHLPSGQNLLEQLILIIGDGRFNEQSELLKPYIRDIVSRKRMVAYIILDSQEESILDYRKISFVEGKSTFTKYLDSFPFPYYIVLKNIDALPGTLADLLRQWFELMQRATY